MFFFRDCGRGQRPRPFYKHDTLLIMNNITDITQPFTGDVPGCAILVLKNGAPIITEVHGHADLEAKMPVTAETNFRLASVSKHFTVSAVLRLNAQGKLTLSDTLGTFFPEFPEYGKNITIAQLLTHTSGLVAFEEVMEGGRTEQIHDEDVLALLIEKGYCYFTPGSAFRYSDAGYCLLALIVARVYGMSFAEFMRNELFEPLGMEHTYINEEGVTKIPNRAYGYSRQGEQWVRTDQNITSGTIGDGGIYSSLADLTKWDAALEGSELFGTQVLTDLAPAPIHYGYGFFLKAYRGTQVQYHGGSTIGFRSGYYRVPELGLTIIVLTNRNEGEGPALCEAILNRVLCSKWDTERS